MPEIPPALAGTRREVLRGGVLLLAGAGLTAPPRGAARVVGDSAVPVSRFYRPEHGNNLQPAFQAAIDHAAAGGIPKVVNDRGAIGAEMWCPRRISPFSDVWGGPGLAEADGVPLVVRDPVHLDFAGASFDLKGPGGGRREQRQVDYRLPYLGGWLYVIGRPGFGRVTVENVTVDGHFPGPFVTADASNPSDKRFRTQNTEVRKTYLRNLELRNFGCEIYYVAGMGPQLQYLENCHFHGSPQSASNPGAGGGGKLLAINLQAGRAYQASEALGSGGHRYVGGRFYDCGHGGTSFLGGPSPRLLPGRPFSFAQWDGRGERPWVEFENTLFERCRFLHLGAWMRGRIKTIDTTLNPRFHVGYLRDIDLTVESWCDRRDGMDAIEINGPPNLTTPVPGTSPRYDYRKPSNMRFTIDCRRTDYARARGYRHRAGVMTYGGLVDARTVAVALTGEAGADRFMAGRPVPGFAWPAIDTRGFRALG